MIIKEKQMFLYHIKYLFSTNKNTDILKKYQLLEIYNFNLYFIVNMKETRSSDCNENINVLILNVTSEWL